MRILPPVEEKIRRTIRDARVLDPLITVSGLQDALEKKLNRTFTRKYIAKLADKVARQALIEADRMQIEERLGQTRENYRLVRERLLKIVYWTPETGQRGIKLPFHYEIIEAAKTLVMLDLALMKAEIENGLYKRPVEAIAKEFQYQPLPAEIRDMIIRSFSNFGLLPAATIEKMVPLQIHARVVGD